MKLKPVPVAQAPRFVSGSLPLVKGRETRFVQLTDTHAPYSIPLGPVFEFIEDYKPDYVLLTGDNSDMSCFSHWEKRKRGTAQLLQDPKDYYGSVNGCFYEPLRRAAPKSKIVHFIGNHEAWAYQAIDDMPEGRGYWEPENNIRGVDLWVRQFRLANLGKLHFLHGEHAVGKYHAHGMLQLYRRSLRYGHRHDGQEAFYTSPVDVEDRHSARCCGTLQHFNPNFMQNRPHNWVHGFNAGIVAPDGMFWDQLTKIIRGRFYAESRWYK